MIRKLMPILFFLVLFCGCHLLEQGVLPIEDAEIQTVSKTAGDVVETVARPAVNYVAPGLGGLAGIIGAAVAIGVRGGLKALQKKKDNHIREVARGEN